MFVSGRKGRLCAKVRQVKCRYSVSLVVRIATCVGNKWKEREKKREKLWVDIQERGRYQVKLCNENTYIPSRVGK